MHSPVVRSSAESLARARKCPGPDSVLDPVVLYSENCAGCHGAEGKNGPAMALSDPVYLAIVDDDTLRTTISKGRPGTAMSAFAQKEGGMLTDEADQRDHSRHPRALGQARRAGRSDRASLRGKEPGNPQQGEAVYATFCASCHGSGDKGGPKAGSVTNGAYLSLISDQGLRTIVITGRPDFDAPDWRGNVPGPPDDRPGNFRRCGLAGVAASQAQLRRPILQIHPRPEVFIERCQRQGRTARSHAAICSPRSACC